MAEERKVVLDFDLSEGLKALLQYRDSLVKGEGEATEFEKSVSSINNELEKQIKLERQQANEIKKLQDRLKELSKLQKESSDPDRIEHYNREIKQTQVTITKLSNAEKGRLATIKKLQAEQEKLGRVGEKAGKASNKSFRELIDSTSEAIPQVDKVRGLLTSLGRTAGPVAAVAAVASLGVEAFNLSLELSKIAEQIRGLTGLTRGQALEQAGAIKSLADTYNIDLNTAITTVNSASKGFGVNFSQAIDLINNGLAGGLEFSEEYLENLKEYPSALSGTITSLRDFNALILLQQQEGFFNDKLVDAVKEFEISIRELAPTTKEAFGKAGLAGALKDFQDGTIDARQLLNLTGKRMAELGPQSRQVGILMADVFRSAGEDSIKPLVRVFGNLEGNLQRAKISMEEMGEAQINLFNAQKQLNEALASDEIKTVSDTFTNIKAAVFRWTAEIIKANDTFGEFITRLIPGVAVLKSLRTAYRAFTGDTDAFTLGFERANEAQEIGVIVQKRAAELRKLENAGIRASVDAIENRTKAILESDDITKENLTTLRALKSALDNIPTETQISPTPFVDPAEAKKANEEIRRQLEKAAREEELRLKLKAKIEIDAAGGNQTLEGLNLLESLEKQNFTANAQKIKLDTESLAQGLLNIENQFSARRDALRQQQADKELADQKKLNEEKASAQKAAFEKNLLFASEQFAKEEELAQRVFLQRTLSAGTNIEAQQRAAEDFQRDAFDAELRFLENVKLVKQTANQETIEEAKRINDILIQIQEDRIAKELDKEASAKEKRIQIRQAVLSGASQIAGALSQLVEANLQRELAAVEGNKQAEERIRKRFAEKQKRIQLVQSAINVAQGITAALGSAPPPANFILAALTAAAGAIQIAAIASQGFVEGGYTGKGRGRRDDTGHKPAGIVHEGEHVSPKRIVDDPQEGKIVQYLESVRVGKPDTGLLMEYAKAKGIIPDLKVYPPLSRRPELLALSGKTVQDSGIRHIEIKSGRVDIDYDRVAKMIAKESDSEYKSEVLFKLLREQQNSNIALRNEVATLRVEVKKLQK